jgi:hypothetical protein
MTVAELIVRLQQLDPATVVAVPGPRGAHGSHDRLDLRLTPGHVVLGDDPDVGHLNRCHFVHPYGTPTPDERSPFVLRAVMICHQGQ